MTARYRLKDVGYSSYRKIMRGNAWDGRVHKNADGSFTGIIGRVQCSGSSWEDAFNQVVAKAEGIPVANLNRVVSMADTKEHTRAILIWLANLAESHDGHLHFSNADLARLCGWTGRQIRPLGNIMSRLDLLCCMTGLPSLGCAAESSFKKAWQDPDHDWEYPVELMQRRAKSHHWTRNDFARLQRENLGLVTGAAPKAWGEYMAKHESRVKAWAYQEEED